MKKNMILVSGMPAAGKTTFAKWLSEKLYVPLVCYDNILEKTLEIAIQSCENEEQLRRFYSAFPYMFFWFNCEEIMKSSSFFILEYFFTNMMKETLDKLTDKYQYETLTVHCDCDIKTAYNRFVKRSKSIEGGDKIRPNNITFDEFYKSAQQNKDFNYGDMTIYIDTNNFDNVSYNQILEQIRQLIKI